MRSHVSLNNSMSNGFLRVCTLCFVTSIIVARSVRMTSGIYARDSDFLFVNANDYHIHFQFGLFWFFFKL